MDSLWHQPLLASHHKYMCGPIVASHLWQANFCPRTPLRAGIWQSYTFSSLFESHFKGGGGLKGGSKSTNYYLLKIRVRIFLTKINRFGRFCIQTEHEFSATNNIHMKKHLRKKVRERDYDKRKSLNANRKSKHILNYRIIWFAFKNICISLKAPYIIVIIFCKLFTLQNNIYFWHQVNAIVNTQFEKPYYKCRLRTSQTSVWHCIVW